MLASINGLFRLTRDAELRYSNSSTAILKLGLACSEKRNEKETQLFIDATAFGRSAEILNQYAGAKGTQIYIRGKLQTEQWTNDQGEKRSKISMIIEGFDFTGSRTDNSNAGASGGMPQESQHMAGGYPTAQQGQDMLPYQYQSDGAAQSNADYQASLHQQQPPAQPSYNPQTSIPTYDVNDEDIPFGYIGLQYPAILHCC